MFRTVTVIGSEPELIKARRLYQRYQEEFTDRLTEIEYEMDVSGLPGVTVYLIGFDREIKQVYKRFQPRKILADIDAMPMGHYRLRPTSS